MANKLKDMKKDDLIIMIGELKVDKAALVDELKEKGIVVLSTEEALETARDDLGKALERVIELEALVPADQVPEVEAEEEVMMVCLCNEVFTDFDKPTRYGYEATPNKMNDLVCAVPVSRVAAELSREGNRLLTLDEYLEHVQETQKVEKEDLVELEDELK